MENTTTDVESTKKRVIQFSQRRKTVIIYILSFLMPALLMMAIFHSVGISYGGRVTVLTFDLDNQYAPFIAGLRYLLEDPRKILFNWNASLGGNYMGVFAYYLASPLNLITLLWKTENIADAMYVLIVLKIGLCGLTFNTFLHRRNPERKISFYNLMFSLCYALMSYNIAYGMCVMWLDAIILFPIVLLGIERILSGKKGCLYFISMTLVFITNYYMAYMVGIFVLMYFTCGVLAQINKSTIKYYAGCTLRFGINTLLGLCVSMPLVLPALMNLKFRYATGTGSTVYQELAYDFHLDKLLIKFLPSQYDSLYSEYGEPYIYCGTIMLLLSIFYFFQKRNWKEKILSLCILLVIFSGFVFQKMDYFWHGFTYPTDFPYRYAFLFCGFILLLAHESWTRLSRKGGDKMSVVLLFCIYTIVELYINGNAIVNGIYQEVLYDIREEIQIQNDLYSPLAKEIRNTTGMYRMREQRRYFGYNLESAYGLNGMDFFASNYNAYVLDFLSNMGGASANYSLSACGFTPLADSIFGVDYIIGLHNPVDLYNEVLISNTHNRTFKLFENPYSLGIAFMTKQTNEKETPQWEQNPFLNQQKLLEYLGVEDNSIYHPIPFTKTVNQGKDSTTISIEFTAHTDNTIYYFINGMLYEDAMIYFYLNDELILGVGPSNLGGTFELSQITTQDNVLRIEGPFYDNVDFWLYSFDKEAYLSAINQLKSNQLENVHYEGNIITGTVDSGDGGTLFTTIPYDDGFSIYVDGNKTKYDKALDTFISIELPSGTHNIKFVYIPPGLFAGLALFFVSLIGIGLYYKRRK